MTAPSPTTPTPPLWREALGRALRLRRTDLGLTLAQVSRRSGVSTQFLSEVERGLKDPSSEVIEAVAVVLGLELPQVLVLAAGVMDAGRFASATLTSIRSVQAAPTPPAAGQAQLSLAA
ncbi:helix-turn-helix domain-containing protein [Brevibacterium atlanticum]|uniref:helix-turn-helix domain-containing protein n=1 Tax=Brevibacterium atlanticum TaxID=2697563 RepID=UPI001AA12E98|nr:helix-turn-helix transcriptional regulator [Brevibacterium atlanticum]